MDLRTRKLSRLGTSLMSAWACMATAVLVIIIGGIIETAGSGRLNFGTVMMMIVSFALFLLVPTLDMLFEYSGFAFSYEGRHIPSMLFSGIRTLFVIALPVAVLAGAFKGINSGVNVLDMLTHIDFARSDVLVLIGFIMLMAGIVLNGLLFCAYAFTSARYNGKTFMIMGIIFSGIEVVGILLTIISVIIDVLGNKAATRAIVSGSAVIPWWVYATLFFFFIGKVMQLFSFITGYSPVRIAAPAAPASPAYPAGNTYSGYTY